MPNFLKSGNGELARNITYIIIKFIIKFLPKINMQL
jgi:hypothetical protein